MSFASFNAHIFLFFQMKKGYFTQVFSKIDINFRQNPRSSQYRLDSSTCRLHWPAGRQKLSGYPEPSLKTLEAKWFFGQFRLPWLAVKRGGAGSGCRAMPPTAAVTARTAAVEQLHWLGAQGDLAPLSASAEALHQCNAVRK